MLLQLDIVEKFMIDIVQKALKTEVFKAFLENTQGCKFT
jgi:hypothetical protein